MAVAALEYLGAAMGLGLPTDRLREAAGGSKAQIGEQVAGSPDVQRMVAGFEARFDARAPEDGPRSLLIDPGAELPGGEELAEAAEAFLAGQADDGGHSAERG